MADELEPLILDLVEWVAITPRAYDDVMDRWRTSCPRLTVWEDALERGLVRRQRTPGQSSTVAATELGHAYLASNGRPVARTSNSSA